MSRLVCITGATGNLGVFVASTFLNRGCRVLLQSRSQEKLNATVQRLHQQHGCSAQLCSLVADVTTESGIDSLVEVLRNLSTADPLHLVNLVGEFPQSYEFEKLPLSELRRILHVNALSAIDLVQACTTALTVESIVLCSSIGALQPLKHRMHYRLSKMLVVDAVNVLCRELAPKTRINAVAPGAMFGDAPPVGAPKEIAIPLARYGNGNDIAEAIWLLTVEATYVTGQHLVVDGGLSL